MYVGSGFDRMEERKRNLTIPAQKVETGDDFTRMKNNIFISLFVEPL